MSTSIAILVLVFVLGLLGYKFINREERADKTVGTIYVYQDPQTGEFELYLEPSVTPKEMATREEVCFKVEYIARK